VYLSDDETASSIGSRFRAAWSGPWRCRPHPRTSSPSPPSGGLCSETSSSRTRPPH
jgi:hypothetical protein